MLGRLNGNDDVFLEVDDAKKLNNGFFILIISHALNFNNDFIFQ